MSGNRRVAGCCLCFLSLAAGARGQSVEALFENGPTERRLNIVLLSEGYREPELAAFREKAGQIVNHLFSEDPFSSYQEFFNAYTISIASNESGADEPKDDRLVDTAFDATFDSHGSDRLLTVNSSKVTVALLENFPEYDIVLVVVNSSRYGGSGGVFAVTSTNSDSFEIAVHELGHSFGELQDEYEYEGAASPQEGPNVTAETRRDQVKWNAWFEEDTPTPTPEQSGFEVVVGLFEGAMYNETGWYRPHYNSKMRSLDRPWGQVNGEQLILRMYFHLPLFTSATPSDKLVVVYEEAPIAFALEQPLPDSAGSHVYEWRLDGQLVFDGGPEFLLDPRLLANGAHQLEVEVRDETERVRGDAGGLLSGSRSWELEVALEGEPKSYANWAIEAIPYWELRLESLDIDRDGYSNLEEFFLGSDPLKENGEPHSIAFGFEDGALVVDIEREPLGRMVRAEILASWLGEDWERFGVIEDDQAIASAGGKVIANEDFSRIRIVDASLSEAEPERRARVLQIKYEAN